MKFLTLEQRKARIDNDYCADSSFFYGGRYIKRDGVAGVTSDRFTVNHDILFLKK